jgi:hypothetical protein
MPELKTKSNGYLGFIHFLIAGLIVPFIGGIVVGALGLEAIIKNAAALTLCGWILGWIIIWLGIMLTAQKLLKTYTISSPHKIAVIATTYYVVVSLILFMISILNPSVAQSVHNQLLLQGILGIVNFVAFFWISKHYLSKQQVRPVQTIS